MGECKPCHGGGKLYGAFGDSWPCVPCRGTGKVRNRWQVACINWESPTAPKAIAYRIGRGGMSEHEKDFPTHAEAIAYADRMARTNQGENNE